ncbi:uncharacterized protein LOC135161158 [Diachasmimorpha longicaudata]|uniref:uncharacterized protein LOC135161158 n=1 Tax=Diachasmimorpha longicaudata TaxID=58733 RepID=UPI0030B869E1
MIPASGESFWATVEILVHAIPEVARVDRFSDDIEDWLETVANKVKMLRERKRRMHQTHNEGEIYPGYRPIIDCSFSNPPVRSKLEMLMGSSVVRLTDRRYMLKLMARIRQDYERRQEGRIDERKKNELIRTKMMILNRLIPVQEAPLEIRRYPLFQLYLYCDAIIEEKRKKRSPKQIKIAQSLYRNLYPHLETEEKLGAEETEVYMKRITVNGSPELIPLTAEELAEVKREEEAESDIDNGYMLSQEEYDRLHYETAAIKDLREAQNVEDMYARAHEILGILYSYVDDGKYKKLQKDESSASSPQGQELASEPETTAQPSTQE